MKLSLVLLPDTKVTVIIVTAFNELCQVEENSIKARSDKGIAFRLTINVFYNSM